MFFAALLLALAPGPRSPDEFLDRCAALGSSEALERAAAERWLAAHLTSERYPELLNLARSADAEVRARLVRIVAADARHLEFALTLAAEPRGELAQLGREALRASLAALDPRLGEPARRGPELQTVLTRMAGASAPSLLVADFTRTLGDAVLELESSGGLELGLTLEPTLAGRMPRVAGEGLGPWDEVLGQLARAYGFVLEGYGLPGAREAETEIAGFLRLANESDRLRSGVEVLADWMLLVASGAEGEARLQAARNLAAVDLGPLLAWLARRAVAGDEAAYEGLLLAGARGRVARELGQSPLLERLFQTLVGGERRAALALGTLEALPGSEALGARLLESLRGVPAARWAALHWFEHSGLAQPEALACARELLAAPTTPLALRQQALLACARLLPPDAPAPSLAQGLELLAQPMAREEERVRLARALAAARIPPPARDPRELAALESTGFAWTTRLNLLEAWLVAGERAVVGAHFADWVAHAGADEARFSTLLASGLAHWPRQGAAAELRRALAEARRLAPEQQRPLERLELLFGFVPAGEVGARLARGGWLLSGPQADLGLLGALAGYPVPIEAETAARETLHGALASAIAGGSSRVESLELLAALERAATGLYAAGRDEDGDAFTKRVRTAVRQGPKGTLHSQVQLELWPRSPAARVLDVRWELESRLPPAGL